uniref:KASH domain-containing protein n=1 Tax=Lutzomyia longipalpis TaxID=7200 RepID=A0A1B0CCM2_LUTLO
AAKKDAEEEKDEDTFEIVKSEELEKESSKGSSRKASGSDEKMKGEGDEKVLECQRAPVDLVTATAHVDENQPNVEIADTNVRREEECPSEFPQPVGTSTAIPQVHATDDEVEGSTAPHKELIVTDIKEIWPPTETIDEIPVHLLDTITHDDTKNAIDHTTDEIWPTNPDIGADVDLQRYGVSVTVVEHVIETVEKHPEEKSLEISQKAPIDELKVTAAVVEASPETPGEDRKKVQGDKAPPSEQEKPREAPDTPKVPKEEKKGGQQPPSEPSTPHEKSEVPEESHAVGDEGERTRIKVTLPSLTSAAESTLTVNMKMEPTEHTKINVNLTEIAPVAAIPDTSVQIIEEVSQKSESPKISTPEISEKTPEKIVLEVHEKISGSDEQEVRQTGYEAEDVTVDDANEESRKSKRKKKRKQKLKAKDGGETTDDQESSASKHSAEAEESTKVEKEGVEKEISPDESYGSISEYDPESVRIMEEAVIQSPSPDDLKPLPSELVTTVPVMDTLYVEESEQQTSLPYEEVPKEEIPRESPPKEAVVQDEHSVQTSPIHQPQPMTEISQQTSPEPEPEHQETEAQTILIESTEVEIQTTPIKLADEEDVPVPKAEVTSEEIQTEPVVFGEKIEAPPVVETTDSTSQTTVLDTREQNLQTSPTESPEHHPRKDVSQEEDVSTIASRIVDEIVAGIPTPTAAQETNTETVTIHEATVQTTPPAATPTVQSPEHVETLQIEEVPEVSEPPDVEDSPFQRQQLNHPERLITKIPENFSVEVTRSFDLEDGEGPKSFHEIVEIPSADEPPKPKSVTISLVKKTVVDELFDEPDVQEEQRKVERMLEGRLKMSQDARQSPLSNVLHLATLSESITEEPMEERLEVLQENLAELEDAIQRQDSRVIHRTVTIIFEKISAWLETIEYRVYVTRQSASSEPSERKIGEFNELRNELECIQNYVEHLRKDLEQPMQDVESENMVQCVNVIVDHLRAIDNVTQSSEMQVQDDFRRFSEYQMNVDELQMNIQQLKSNLDRIVSEEMGLDKKLHLLDEFDDINRAFGKEVQRLIHVARGLERDFPEKETPEQIFMCREMVANLDGTINIERNRLNQLVNLAQEYEQTLNEFAKIILIADSLVESQITTSNLDNLQNEIQKHRKFFVNLSHCRAILESLEMNLDPVTREKHSQLHQTLHESATTILDKASDRAQRLSMAASRWTVLERGMREEKQWLQIAQQRIPDLTEVTSTDYDQYINMYHCLSADIAHHHAKLVQLTTTAVKLQELVSASNVEDDCNEQLFMILKLKEDVALNLKKLLKFRQYWILYETTTDKIENWITTSEHHLEKIEIPKFFKEYPLEHMRLFWDIKAEFELYNSIKADAVTNLERALEVVPIADELLQKEFHQRLEDKWGSVEEKIHRIQQLIVDGMSASNVPTDEKLTLLQKELDELEKAMASVKGVIRSQDELQLYIERMQILNSRVVIVGTELGCIGLTSSSDSERIGRLFGMSHRISMQISEELDGALVLQDQLNKISHGIIRMRLLQQSGGETLDQCEGIDLSGTEIVENALYDCQRVHGDLKTHWQGIMELRQLLHTLPMRLKISVSPVMLERDISQLQDDHVVLESRCEKILSSLRGALHLWKTFEKQLEQVQQSIQQTDYMVELLKVYGQVDYERLVKATERLEGLHGDLDSHEDLLEDLKCSAEPLVEICSAEVAHKIEVAVQETIQAWNETSQNLTGSLKYQRAVRLWQQYRDATESLNNWVDEKESDLKVMDPNGDLQYIKECLNALPAYKERLAEVRQMVDQISADIELEPGSLLEMDVESLGARLETMKEAITVLADEAEKKLQKTAELEQEVRDSQRQLEATQKAIEDIPEEIATEEHLLNLRNHLVKLSCTQNQIQKMHSTKLEQNITTNVSIVEVLKIWQRLFKDTFQQYYRLSSTLIQNEDVDAVLKLWEDYLRHVQTFLATSIPQNYSSLSDHRHICEVHQNLLSEECLRDECEAHVAERFTELVRLHNDVLQKLNARHSEVEERIGLWDKYNREMTELLEWLKDMEQSRTRLQLSYLNLRRVPKIRQTLDSLLARVPEGEEKSHQLKQQHGVLLKFCDDALGTSIKMGHAAVNQRISNLKAALETWRDFVNRIVHLENVYQQKVAFVQDSLQATQKLYTEVSQKNQVTDGNIKQQINDLREKRIEVNKLSVDLEQIGVVLEEMKECVSPYDLKSMRQIVWILWQQQGDLNQQLGSYINNLVDKLSLWKMFNDKYTVLSAWMDHLEKRIEMGTQFAYVGEPEEIQRYIENEIATEMSFKERDRDWVLSSGRQLLTHFSDADDQSQATEIQEKLNTIIERWEKLKYLTKVRGNELKDLRLTTMRLEIRIAELRSWLFKMETDVTRPLHLDDLTEASRRKCRQEHDELQRAMEKECINFAEVLNLCDMLFKDVNTWKSHFNIGALSVAINNVEKRWGNVCNLLTVRGNKIHTMWKLFGELQKVDDDHRQWVMEKKRLVDELQRQRVPRDELAERVEFIREQIEEVRHREPLRYQQEKNYHGLVASNTLDTNNINELLGNVPAILNDWSTLLPSLMALHEKLQGDLCLYGKFVQSHEKAVLNLTQIDAHLTQVEVSTPPNAQEILSVEEELKDCSEVLETADKLGLALMETFPDVAAIQAMVDEYQNLYRDISSRLQKLREQYVVEVDESVQVNTLTFEQDSAVQVNTLTFVTAKDAYILELKSAIKEMKNNLKNLETALNDTEAKSLKTIKSNKIVAACESSVELIRHLSMLLKTECHSTDEEACVEEGLHGDLDSHEDLLEDLKCSAEPLVEICSAEVAHKIEVAVQETIQAWNETSQNLTDLCSKYQRAVRLWQQYRDATESLNNWVDEKESDLKVMDPNGDLQYIKECLNALPAYKERLAEVRQMVDQISADIELEPGSLLEMDVESLGARLETMKEAITVLADEAEKKLQKTAELEQEVRDSQRQLEATQKAIEDIPEEIATEEHLLNLRNHLVKLSCTQNQIQKMHSTKLEQNITTNVSIVEVLKIWQRLFKDTFQQYYRLSSTLIQNEDVDAVLKLWEDYLRHVQTFLATSIPQNYSSLSDHRHICEVHQSLLVSQKNVYEMNVKPHVAERFTELVRLHNDVLQKLNARHSEVEERIGLWDKYNREMTELLGWLKDMEQSRTRLQLSYLNLRRVPKIRQTLDSLLARVPEGEEKSHQLKQQHGVLLKFCDDALGTSIKMGHAAVNQRISNLKAALETWRDFVNRIVHLENVYQQKVAFVQDSLQATQKLYTEVSQKNQVTDGNIKQQINDLREKRIEVNKLSVDLEQIGVVLEEMKECVSPYDLKSMRQIVWILWQQQGDLNQQLGSYINNLVDKLSLWKMFNDKYTVLSAWMDHLEKRIEMGTQFAYVGEPEEIQRYIENEIATEMSFKERDRDWVLSSGRQLLTHFSDADDQSQATEIQEKLNTIIERWEKLKYLTKVRGNELKDLRLTTMRLEIRIAELRSWLFKMETDVTRPLHLDDLTEASRRKCRQEHDELQRAMEKECINFAEVLNLCDMLFKDVNTWKSHFNIGALSVAINNVEKRWGNVCNLLTVRGNKIHTMWKLFGELQKVDDDHRQWVMEKKRLVDELQRQRVPRDELAERVEFIREQIEEVRHREPLRYQQEKNYHGLVASNTLDTNNINELLGNVPAILNDWSTLLPSLMALHEKLQGDLCLYGKFVQSHEKAVLNLTQIDAHLTQVEVSTPPNAQEILSVEEELKDCSEVLETADKLGLALMETFPDVAAIQAMVDEYQNLYRDISSRLQKLREQYVVEVDESVQVNTLTFEQDSAVQVNTLTFVTAKDAYILELKSAIKEMKNNLKNLETALNDTEAKSLKTIKSNKIVAACESSVELIRHLSMLLKTECHSTDEEACVEEVNDLLTKHENLMILWRSKEQKLQELSDLGRLTCPLCTQKNWQQIDNDLWRLEQWLHDLGRLTCPLCTQKNWQQIDNDLWRLEQWLQFAEGTQRLQSSPRPILMSWRTLTDLRLRLQSLRRLTGVYVVKLGAVLGVESTEISLRTASPYQTQSTNQLDEFGVPLEGAHSSPQLNEDESNGGDEINTSVLARGYRFLGRVLRASLPIQALMLLLLGVVTLVPHAEDYSCIFTNNFARSLEPMLRYPNGPPPI